MPITIDCFKAYDIRGVVPDQLDSDLAYRIGRAIARALGADDLAHGELGDGVEESLELAGCSGGSLPIRASMFLTRLPGFGWVDIHSGVPRIPWSPETRSRVLKTFGIS